MLFIEYPKCSTCKKAKKWLDDHNITYTDRHIVEENPTYDELKEWYIRSGLPLKKFFNTSGMLYKEMQLKDCWFQGDRVGTIKFMIIYFTEVE